LYSEPIETDLPNRHFVYFHDDSQQLLSPLKIPHSKHLTKESCEDKKGGEIFSADAFSTLL